jgi:putative peptidoglycan lipid II flippase
MVKRIFNILNKEIVGLHQAAYLLGMFAFLSQILALIRDRLLASSFGAGSMLDVYYAAFRIPDFIFVSIASFVSITVLIPFLADRINFEKEQNKENAKKFISDIFTVFIVVIVAVTGVIFLFVPFFADIIAPGFSAEQKKEFIILSRILLASPILLGLSSMLGSVTQVYRKFFIYAGAPILYNVGIIIGILFFYPIFGLFGVAIGVILGALLHFLIQIPVVVAHGLMPKFSFHVNISEIKKVVFLSFPRTLTLSSNHITLIILVALASLMIDGSISVFNFSFNLQSVPLSIIGVSYSIAAFPTLSRLFSKGNRKEFCESIVMASRHIIFWSIPAIVLFIVLRAQIVRVILGSGQFDWSDTRLTAASLAVFSVSILAQSLQLLFVRGYYAAGRTKVPLFVNVFSAIFTISLGFLLVNIFQTSQVFRYFIESLLRIDDISGSSVVMLPLAYSIGIITNAGLLWMFFARDFKEFSLSIERAFAHSFAASIIMGFVAYRFLVVFSSIFNLDTFLGVFLQGFFAGILGIIAGVFIMVLLGNQEIAEIVYSIKHKLKGIVIVAPDKEDLE